MADWTPASKKPFFMLSAIIVALLRSLENEIMEGPAPLMVVANAPAFNEYFFTISYPVIICFLTGSIISSLIPLPIITESLIRNPETTVLALKMLCVTFSSDILFGSMLLARAVFLLGTFTLGIPIINISSEGGSILMTSNIGLVLTMTNPPNNDAATLS